MQDRLIFPTRLEQIATGELVHDNFPAARWTSGEDVKFDLFSPTYVSDLELDVSPVLFFQWAYTTIGGNGSGVLFYCVNLSTQLLLEPQEWMLDIVTRSNFKQLTDGSI
jgi:hypothetical protein